MTATEIRVAWPTSVCGDRPCRREGREEYAILAHFNQRYELRFTAATIPADADGRVFNPEAGCR
ncbi:MAG TPA: hypothetical protein VGA69_11840 [Nitriliruptorales bacterium]